MKTLRIVLRILTIIPLALLMHKLLFYPTIYDEDSPRTLAFIIFGVPILIFNLWVWFAPKTIEFYFFGNKEDNT